jgi:fumarate reductase subunit C
MMRGLGPAAAAALGGRSAARWCTYRRVTVAVCLGNLVAVLLVVRSLYSAPGYFASAPRRVAVKYSEEQIRLVEESIRIRRAAVSVELVEAV